MNSMSGAIPPMFHSGVGHVIGVRAKEQMLRVDAMSHVTMVTDEQPLWDRSAMKNPGCPMREHNVTLRHREHAIPTFARTDTFHERPSPKPACVGLIDSFKEAFKGRTIVCAANACVTTELRQTVIPGNKRPSAKLTDGWRVTLLRHREPILSGDTSPGRSNGRGDTLCTLHFTTGGLDEFIGYVTTAEALNA